MSTGQINDPSEFRQMIDLKNDCLQAFPEIKEDGFIISMNANNGYQMAITYGETKVKFESAIPYDRDVEIIDDFE